MFSLKRGKYVIIISVVTVTVVVAGIWLRQKDIKTFKFEEIEKSYPIEMPIDTPREAVEYAKTIDELLEFVDHVVARTRPTFDWRVITWRRGRWLGEPHWRVTFRGASSFFVRYTCGVSFNVEGELLHLSRCGSNK